MANVATDLTIMLPADRPGALAGALEGIARAGINVDGFAELEGVLHVLTRDAAATQRALRASGIRVRGERSVAVVTVEDRPGMAARMFRRIAEAGINVDYSYLASNHRIVIGVDDPRRINTVVG